MKGIVLSKKKCPAPIRTAAQAQKWMMKTYGSTIAWAKHRQDNDRWLATNCYGHAYGHSLVAAVEALRKKMVFNG